LYEAGKYINEWKYNIIFAYDKKRFFGGKLAGRSFVIVLV
jgi:hypothetical protein